jgi:hypothetical protein
VKKNHSVLKSLADTAKDAYADWQRQLAASPDKAFDAGMKLLEAGYTHYDLPNVLAQLDKLAAGTTVKVSDADRKELTALGDAYRASRKAGFAESAQLDAGVKPLDP